VLEDLREAWRRLRRPRGTAGITVLVLALGVAAAVSVASVVKEVLLRPLPYPEPERLVRLYESNPDLGRPLDGPSPVDYLDWVAEARSFSHLAAAYTRPATLRGDGVPEAVQVSYVSPAFFELLGAPGSQGRLFDAGRAGAAIDGASRFQSGDRLAILSRELWQRRYGADPRVIGRTIDVDRVPWVVAGVAPAHLDLPVVSTDLWLAWDIAGSYAHMLNAQRSSGAGRDWRFLQVFGRLTRGVAVSEAGAEVTAIAAEIAERFPTTNAGWTALVVPLRESLVGSLRTPLLVMLAAVACVLGVALANAAGLQLASASERSRDLALRSALGAAPSRLVRQLLAESLLLGAGGAALGLLVAALALRLLVALRPEGIPRLHEIGLDAGLATSALGAATLGAMLAAWLPIRRAAAAAPSALRDGARGSAGAGGGRVRLRRALVSAQAGVSLALLAGALLLTRTFVQLASVSPGFDTTSLLVARMRVEADAAPFYARLLERLRALPGVAGAGATTALPLSEIGTDFDRPYWLDGEERLEGRARLGDIRMVTPEYFDALGLPLVRGRDFDVRDVRGAPRVVAVSQALARSEWPAGDPVGRRIAIDYMGGAYLYEVVGVVGDTRFHDLRESPRPEIYIPHAQNPYLEMNVAVRAGGEPGLLASALRRAVADLDPDLAVHSTVTMEELMSRRTARERLSAALLSALAGLAAALAAASVYALQAYLVGRRRSELAVRVALGARGMDLAALVLWDALRAALPGALAGLGLAWALGRAAQGLLFRVEPHDPLALGGAAVLVAALALAAALPAARRASRVDPAEALRSQ
jgi:predicted permease